MLSLCARAMERAAGERARDFPEARTKATREKKKRVQRRRRLKREKRRD
jgi:hypothetical protein